MIAKDYIERRLNLHNLLPKNSITIVYARDLLHRIPTIPYRFNQFSDYLYLTGLNRPSGALVIYTKNNSPVSTLFLPKLTEEEEKWSVLSTIKFDDATKISGVNSIYPLSEFSNWISSLIRQNPDHTVFASLPPHQSSPFPFRLLSPYLDRLRVIKSPKEISLMKKASSITTQALTKVLPTVAPGLFERQIAARFEDACVSLGATGLAYPIECQSGRNSLCLHYMENSGVLQEGETLLIDAGCEVDGYASDFTRTVPIGKVTTVKKVVLEIVEKAKDALVKSVSRGNLRTLNQINNEAQKVLLNGLHEIGIKTDLNGLSQYFPHRVSHWIGLDVHDCTTVDGDFEIKKGCAFSVEPGLYFRPNIKGCPKELVGLGVRFEDTVIIE